MTREEIREENLRTLSVVKKDVSDCYYICEIRYANLDSGITNNDSQIYYGVVTNIGLILSDRQNTGCYTYNGVVFDLYLITRVWRTRNIGIVNAILRCSNTSNDSRRKTLDGPSSGLIYMHSSCKTDNPVTDNSLQELPSCEEEETEEDKERRNNIINKYGLVT